MTLNACDKLKRFNWTRLFRLFFIPFHTIYARALHLYIGMDCEHTRKWCTPSWLGRNSISIFGFRFVYSFKHTHLQTWHKIPYTPHVKINTNHATYNTGLLRLQQIYQGLRPGNESFQIETVKRIANVSNAINFLRTLETLNRWSRKFIVLDCPTEMAKEIIINHVRDISLGRRTYHYLLSGLVSIDILALLLVCFFFSFLFFSFFVIFYGFFFCFFVPHFL